MKKSKYLSRLIIFTLIISTVPVVFLGIFSYLNSSSNMLKNTTDSQQQLLTQTQISVEQNIHMIENSLTQLTTLSVSLEVIDTPLSNSEFVKLREINRYIEHTTINEIGIHDLFFLNIKKEWAIYPRKIFPLDESFLSAYEKIKDDLTKYPFIISHHESRFSPLSDMEIPYGIIMIRPAPLFHNPDMLVISRIEYDQLNKWIANSNSKKSGHTFILNKDMHLIGSNTEKNNNIALEEIALKELLTPAEATGFLETTFLGETVYMFYQKSSYTDWTYLSVIPKSLITKDIQTIGWISLITIVGIIIVMLILSYKGSVYMYTPIGNLFRVLKNDGEHQQDKNDIDFISQSIKKMRQQIHSQNKELHKFYVLKLFHGELLQNEITEKVLRNHPDFLDYQQYSVVAIQIDTINETRFKESDRDLLLFAAMNIVEETIPATHRLSPVVLNQSLVYLMGFNENDDDAKRDMLHWSKICKTNINQFLNLTISFGISNRFNNLHLAREAYEEGIDALKYRVRFGDNSILFIEDVNPGFRNSVFRYPDILSNHLQDAIKLNDNQKTDELLNTFITTLFQTEGTLTDYQMALIRLLSEMMKLYPYKNENSSLILKSQSLPNELLELKTPHEIRSWFKNRIIEPTMKQIQVKTEQQYKQISDEMMLLVEQDHVYDINLESIGAKLNYSPAYLSQVFRKEKGMPFTEYLTLTRINTAKQWLLETDISINEISTKLNYTNAQNFIRSFKREVDMTPGQYRTKHR